MATSSFNPASRLLAAGIASTVEAIAGWATRHWLFCFNAILSCYLGTIVLAPLLRAAGQQTISRPLYFYFHFLCHQDPDRSFQIAGYQMAVCERCVAIYGALLLGGLLFAPFRARLAPLAPRRLLLFALPMAIDGLTQLVGLRESTWEFRVLTGTLFGLGICWVVLPHLERGMGDGNQAFGARRGGGKARSRETAPPRPRIGR